jgi:hypothetical protein
VVNRFVQLELGTPERLITEGVEPEGLASLLDHVAGIGFSASENTGVGTGTETLVVGVLGEEQDYENGS